MRLRWIMIGPADGLDGVAAEIVRQLGGQNFSVPPGGKESTRT